jgi:hypothetical protein
MSYNSDRISMSRSNCNSFWLIFLSILSGIGIIGIALLAYYGYNIQYTCMNEYNHVPATVVNIYQNQYGCLYFIQVGDGCESAPYNTSTCSQLVAENKTGLCDNGYKCCRKVRSQCRKSTDHQSINVNYGTCYNPIIVYNVTISDGIINQITQQRGLCVPKYDPNDSYECMTSELNGFYVGQNLMVYYKSPDIVKNNPNNCSFSNGYIAGLVVIIFITVVFILISCRLCLYY